MKGLRIRIQNGALQVATYQALGAIPVVIDPSETFLALSQHTIDGVEFGLDTFVQAKPLQSLSTSPCRTTFWRVYRSLRANAK